MNRERIISTARSGHVSRDLINQIVGAQVWADAPNEWLRIGAELPSCRGK